MKFAPMDSILSPIDSAIVATPATLPTSIPDTSVKTEEVGKNLAHHVNAVFFFFSKDANTGIVLQVVRLMLDTLASLGYVDSVKALEVRWLYCSARCP
jgi:hypothetical protein